MPNRLKDTKSLYLKQHADNPVDWWPWCPEAFEEAKKRDVPVLISIGYSACHWCHVMAHESFEDEYIAGLMNKHFVNIKVDREEHPEVDQIYMDAVTMITQSGGWPLNAFCLPDRRPFFGGTYFPPDDRRGGQIIPWPQLLMRISEHFKKSRKDCEENGANILKNISHQNDAYVRQAKSFDPQILFDAAQHIAETHDDEYGGFGGAPKFPPSMTIDFLMAVRATRKCEQDSQLAERIDQVVNTTLHGMAHGGIFDQVGGGFCRYSVDKFWLIPHFEKMGYDNGLLLDAYAKAFLRYQDALYPLVLSETITWLNREMRCDAGGFYASLGAASEGKAGIFYCWTPEQVKAVFGEDDAKEFCKIYHITSSGTFEDGLSNPALATNDIQKRQSLADVREQLLAAREQRVRPGCDTKRLTSWNALLARGIAEAGFALNHWPWVELAVNTASWIWAEMTGEDGAVYRVAYPEGRSDEPGTLQDYTYTAEAFLSIASRIELYRPGAAQPWIDRAQAITDYAIHHFSDSEKAGYFFTSQDQTDLAVRKKEWHDNAIPSSNGALMHIFSSLHALTGDGKYRAELERLVEVAPALIAHVSSSAAHAMSAIVSDLMGVAVIRMNGTETVQPTLIELLGEKPWRRAYFLPSEDPNQSDGFQLCIGTHCTVPTIDPEALAEELS